MTRRQLLKAGAAAALAWQVRPWPIRPPAAFAQSACDATSCVPTLEAFADTLIPGEKRAPDDRAIAGAASGPGAVQAGALDLLNFPAAGTGPALPALAAGLDTHAADYAASHGIVLDPSEPPFVSLAFADRTALLVELLDGNDPDQLAYYAVAALVFLAYHTAAHLHTADAVRGGHSGLAAIGFPAPQADGLWRFPEFSYGRALAPLHPGTTRGGNPP